MSHPAHDSKTSENPSDDVIELHNASAADVPLYDTAHPANRWRLSNAVSFEFPADTVLAAGGCLLVVPFDPAADPAALAAFRARYGTNATLLVGPYSGKLDNSGAILELWRPDTPQAPPRADAGFVPYILVERVVYDADPPWPVAAGGEGHSLQRITAEGYANDPVNWRAALPTAGLANTMRLRGAATLLDGGFVRLTFTVQPGFAYQLESKQDLDDADWSPHGAPLPATADTLVVDDTVHQPQRFYRLRLAP